MKDKRKYNIEELKRLYIDENLKAEEIATLWNVTKSSISHALSRNKIIKPKDFRKGRTNIMKKSIDRDVLYDLFIVQNLSISEIAKKLGLYYSNVQSRINEYGIKKPYSLRTEITKRNNKKKYGAEWYAQTEESTLKRKETCMKKYGVDNPSKVAKFNEKRKETFRTKLGVENPSQLPDHLEKSKKTCMEKYGYEDFNQIHIDKEKIKILSNKGLFKFWLLMHQSPKLTFHDLCDFFGMTDTSIGHYVHKYGFEKLMNFAPYSSKEEKQLRSFLNKIGVKYQENVKSFLSGGRELDIYCPGYNIAIEFNGNYWHSNIKKTKKYHFEKSKECADKGVRLIHIYEYEWNDKNKRKIIESLLKIAFHKIDNRIYARECKIKEISNQEAKPFNELNHLQGHRNAQITYGLFYNDKLVQLMSFSKTKYNRNLKNENSWEIIRGCPGSNNIVVGGVSKLFKHFIKLNNPDSIFSYCDFNKFDGIGYEKIGMKFVGYTGPDMKWWLNDGTVAERNPKKHAEMKKMSKAIIYGSGSKKYLWTREP